MSMTIEGIKRAISSKVGATDGAAPTSIQGEEGGEGFGSVLMNAIKDVDKMQQQADKQIDNLVLGKDGVTSHEAMIALEKADVAFQLMNQIRSKIIRAYEEVMRTQL